MGSPFLAKNTPISAFDRFNIRYRQVKLAFVGSKTWCGLSPEIPDPTA
jgi:hypothetical protein